MDLHLLPGSSMPGIEWPAIPGPAAASMLAMQWQLDKSQWSSVEEIRAEQLVQLRALIAHAASNVPFYRDLLPRIGVARAADIECSDLPRMPLLTKSQLRENGETLRATCMPTGHGDTFEARTSGSTGEPVRVLHSRMSEFFFHALVVREHLVSGRDLAKKFGAIRLAASRSRSPTWGVMAAMFRTGSACTIDALADVDEQLDWLLAERPAYLLAHPSNLRALIVRSVERARFPDAIGQLLTFGETLPADLRDLAQRYWRADVLDSYSCREIGPLAFECPGQGLYHVHAENVLLEVLDDAGAPCEPGETGRVVVTPLHNFAMPLLRYEIGDFAELSGPCACGRGLPALKRIVGRVTNMAIDPTGRRFWPGLRASFLTAAAPFRQLRLVQHDVARMELRYVMDRELTADEQRQASKGLAEMLGYPFQVQFTRVPALERGPGGKYEDFVSLVKRD
jgi:phenylacetate-CoA ligase